MNLSGVAIHTNLCHLSSITASPDTRQQGMSQVLRSPMYGDQARLTPPAIIAKSSRCEELKTGPRIYWHYWVNTDYRRHKPPVNASRRRSTRSASIAERR
jgi:hypothetical protein